MKWVNRMVWHVNLNKNVKDTRKKERATHWVQVGVERGELGVRDKEKRWG